MYSIFSSFIPLKLAIKCTAITYKGHGWLTQLSSKLPQTHMNPLDTTVADSVSSQNQPVFEVCPAQEETEKTDREREKMLFLEQLSMVSEKQRKAREKALLDRLEEKDMLQRTTEG